MKFGISLKQERLLSSAYSFEIGVAALWMKLGIPFDLLKHHLEMDN